MFAALCAKRSNLDLACPGVADSEYGSHVWDLYSVRFWDGRGKGAASAAQARRVEAGVPVGQKGAIQNGPAGERWRCDQGPRETSACGKSGCGWKIERK